jgi:demethylmenaquinone methyltransferase/2-methoxy-6-polyprenyl-1,4-benzoquinol methylase
MSITPSTKHADDIRRMFSHIADRYDLLNGLMTSGRDRHWRRETIRALALHPGEWLLDIGTGTGDLAYEALRQQAKINVVACDFTRAMIERGRPHQNGHKITWIIADARALPFRSGSFDAAVSGFLLRNVPDLETALLEQARTLKSRGRFASLDTTPPDPGPAQALLRFYFQRVIPGLGRWIAGDSHAYRYLADTTRSFHPATKLADIIQSCGFEGVGFVRRMLGTIAIHWGYKPANRKDEQSPDLNHA